MSWTAVNSKEWLTCEECELCIGRESLSTQQSAATASANDFILFDFDTVKLLTGSTHSDKDPPPTGSLTCVFRTEVHPTFEVKGQYIGAAETWPESFEVRCLLIA